MTHLPILHLLKTDADEDSIAQIVRLIRDSDAPALAVFLKPLAIDEQLKHELFDLVLADTAPPPVSEVAAREIFREVLREYQAFNELGLKERRGAIQDFILSVESQCRLAIACTFDEFRESVLEAERPPDAMRLEILACGRYFAASGIWPVKATMER